MIGVDYYKQIGIHDFFFFTELFSEEKNLSLICMPIKDCRWNEGKMSPFGIYDIDYLAKKQK